MAIEATKKMNVKIPAQSDNCVNACHWKIGERIGDSSAAETGG